MPLFKMKKVWTYCTYNKPFFLLILLLYGILNFILYIYGDTGDSWILLIIFAVSILITGYGMTITHDRINNGVRLPKIIIKDVIVLGVKSYIVFIVYLYIQGTVLDWISSPFNFPRFELEDMLLDLPNTLNILISHNHLHAMIFVVVGSIMFYITSFFMEIAIARLADTGQILSAFKFNSIKKDIDTIGWKHYAKHYTLIILAIVLFGSLSYVKIPNLILNYIWVIILNFLMFTTQFLGIGAIYSKIKGN